MRRILRTASFRLAAAYAVVTALAFLVLYLVTGWISSGALDHQIRAGVEAEFSDLMNEYNESGRPEFLKELNARSNVKGEWSFLYYYGDQAGRKVAGNVERIEAFDGWRREVIDQATVGQNTARDDDHQMIAFGKHLADGSFLLVGDDGYGAIAAQEAINEAFAWASVLALALSILAGVIISQRFLKSIDRINATSHAIMRGQLKERIPVYDTSDEIDKLASNLNLMLDGNQALLELLKHMSTNIAHDLRTPMSRLRQHLEESTLTRLSSDAYRTVIDKAIDEIDSILATFSALLRIAQIESGSRKAAFKPVYLSAVAERLADAYRAVAEDDGKSLVSDVAPGIVFVGDEELLTQMLANLIENAIKHTPAGAAIRLELSDLAEGAKAVVADNGPGIPVAERDRVFEQFYRLDRSRTTPGQGLGLSLVSAVAQLHDIAVRLEDNGPGLRVVIDFAATEPRRAAPEAPVLQGTAAAF
jgi:signal transduction histidine kinase